MICTDPTNNKIKEFLKKDSLGRNAFVGNILQVISNIDDGAIIDINGDWGSGKTVVAKELELLVTEDVDSVANIDKNVLADIKGYYSIFYYNAWENDQYDPAESIIFQLISRYWSATDKISDTLLAALKSFTNNLVKKCSNDIVAPCQIEDAKAHKSLIEKVLAINRKRQAATDIIANALERSAKKHLLFIVDELDRCRPDFATKLIEVIKHYFTGESVKVLFLTNNQQLSSIIENSYGEKFSGYAYLDKIFDLIIDIPVIERRNFIDIYCNLEDCQKSAIAGVADYYNMSLREIERFIISYKLSEGFIESSIFHTSINAPLKIFAKHLLLPLILGARVKNQSDFNALIGWKANGKNVIKNVVTENEYSRNVIKKCCSSTYITSGEALYGELMIGTGKTDSSDEQAIRELAEEMISTICVGALQE